jgi:predicted NBD/HSP70 family sugar kinase
MNARIEPSLLGKMSERQVLRALQARGPLSRADVARECGLSAPAVSRAVVALLRSGLVEEIAEPQPTGGRPAMRLQLARDGAQVLGIAIDVDRCRLVSAGLDGQLHDDAIDLPTPATYTALLATLARHARQLMGRHGVATLGVGLSLPGLIDYRAQRSVLSPNVPITDGHSPARDLAAKLGVECLLLQESHALCLAEQHHGEARGLADFAMLDVHTGVGLGVVSGGRLLSGHTGMAGELGHITVVPDGRRCGCGNVGCLETVANDTSLAWRVSKRLGKPVTIDDVIRLHRSGKADLSAELDDVARYLAVALAAVINLFNPTRLFVHGRMFEADDALFAKVVEAASRRSLRPPFQDCKVLRATATKQQGAVAGVIQHLTSALVPTLETNTLCIPTEVRYALPAT